jgi:hypothetical protein
MMQKSDETQTSLTTMNPAKKSTHPMTVNDANTSTRPMMTNVAKMSNRPTAMDSVTTSTRPMPAAFEEDRSPRVVDGRKTYDKSGRQRRGTGIPPQTGIGIREERKRVRAVGKTGTRDGAGKEWDSSGLWANARGCPEVFTSTYTTVMYVCHSVVWKE